MTLRLRLRRPSTAPVAEPPTLPEGEPEMAAAWDPESSATPYEPAAPRTTGRAPVPIPNLSREDHGPSATLNPAYAMKGQATPTDARAERLMRQVRLELEELRGSLEQLSDGQSEMTEIDLRALLANPEAASTLPPWLLVRTLVNTATRLNTLEAGLAEARAEATHWQNQVHDLREERAALRARNDTFAEVAGALHDNLQDLRALRDARMLPPPAPRPALRDGYEPTQCQD